MLKLKTMRYLIFYFILFFHLSVIGQSRVKKLSLNGISNFYSMGEGFTPLNNVVRLSDDGLSIVFKTYDTIKNKGMIYEFMGNSTIAYYKNGIGGNTLKVDDFHANFNFIFPVFIFYTKRIDHTFSVGLGIATLAERDYYDENNNLLPYNSTNLQEVKFGRYWGGTGIFDYELSFMWTKRIGTNFGLRYTFASPVHSSNKLAYGFSQGTALGIKYGFFYQF